MTLIVRIQIYHFRNDVILIMIERIQQLPYGLNPIVIVFCYLS